MVIIFGIAVGVDVSMFNMLNQIIPSLEGQARKTLDTKANLQKETEELSRVVADAEAVESKAEKAFIEAHDAFEDAKKALLVAYKNKIAAEIDLSNKTQAQATQLLESTSKQQELDKEESAILGSTNLLKAVLSGSTKITQPIQDEFIYKQSPLTSKPANVLDPDPQLLEETAIKSKETEKKIEETKRKSEEIKKKSEASMCSTIGSFHGAGSAQLAADELKQHGWIVDVQESNIGCCRGGHNDQGLRCDVGGRLLNDGLVNWWGYKSDDHDVGTVSRTFEGSGSAEIHFGNCWSRGQVNLYKNDVMLARALSGENKTVKFDFKHGDNIQLKEFHVTIMSLIGFKIFC